MHQSTKLGAWSNEVQRKFHLGHIHRQAISLDQEEDGMGLVLLRCAQERSN
jgi:hypothetical protein